MQIMETVVLLANTLKNISDLLVGYQNKESSAEETLGYITQAIIQSSSYLYELELKEGYTIEEVKE